MRNKFCCLALQRPPMPRIGTDGRFVTILPLVAPLQQFPFRSGSSAVTWRLRPTRQRPVRLRWLRLTCISAFRSSRSTSTSVFDDARHWVGDENLEAFFWPLQVAFDDFDVLSNRRVIFARRAPPWLSDQHTHLNVLGRPLSGYMTPARRTKWLRPGGCPHRKLRPCIRRGWALGWLPRSRPTLQSRSSAGNVSGVRRVGLPNRARNREVLCAGTDRRLCSSPSRSLWVRGLAITARQIERKQARCAPSKYRKLISC
jgi:hypothetical protein